MKKACIILRGIHYDSKYCNNNYPIYHGQDYRKSIDNFWEFIYNPLKEIYNSVDIITATYDSKLYDIMIKEYNPIKQIKIEYSKYRNRVIYHALDAIDTSYDFILIYRFDIKLKQKITNMNYNLSMFNIPFKDLDQDKYGTWDKHHRICDAFFIFSGSMLANVISAFKGKYDHPKTHMHTYDLLKKYSIDVNFIINDEIKCNSGISENPLYKNRL
tara:strand:- start:829 stop:1473 length:645 start_codon:yes stop_codon:yes gene_type:complete